MSLTVVQVQNVNAAVKRFSISPFLKGQPVRLTSVTGTPTVYAANHPGTDATTAYARFKQTVTGNKAFKLPTAMTAPTQTSGAVSAANQLKTVVLKNGVAVKHTDDSLVAAASCFCIGVGGGTAVADATLIVKGTTAANIAAGATSLSIASTGADTQTILVGDLITIAGDATVYRATATTTSLNGTTEVLLPITPPLQAATTASTVITCATSDDRTILFATAPTVGDVIEVIGREVSGDIVTLTGGAMVAGETYEVASYDFVHTSGNVDFQRLLG